VPTPGWLAGADEVIEWEDDAATWHLAEVAAGQCLPLGGEWTWRSIPGRRPELFVPLDREWFQQVMDLQGDRPHARQDSVGRVERWGIRLAFDNFQDRRIDTLLPRQRVVAR
jgi:hypothetical protein